MDTEVNTYKATVNELKLIEALSNPENRDLNISQVCELIGISRQAYYKMFKKPDFVKYYNEFQLELVKSRIGDVIKATILFAITEPKCHGDRKMLLEMGKVYTPKHEIESRSEVVNRYEYHIEQTITSDPETAELLKQLYKRTNLQTVGNPSET